MYKVVIIDDEPSVLEGLRLFVNWGEYGYEIVGQASDGRIAVPVIREMKPDLVICDICMPGLTGLDLIERINAELRPAPKFLMLSGYNDFSYAQRALQLGAVGYLSKPLDSDELVSELSRVTAMFENERKANRENTELIRYAANQLYLDIIRGKRNEKLRRKAQFIFSIPENAGIRMIRFFTVPEGELKNTDTDLYDLFLSITGNTNENCVFYNGNGIYIMIMNDGMTHFPQYKELKEKFEAQLSQGLTNLGLQSLWVLISGVFSSNDVLDCILHCDQQLEQLHTYCMLHPENTVVAIEALDENSVVWRKTGTDAEAILSEQAYDMVISAIQGNDAGCVSQAVEAFFSNLYQNVSHDQLFSVCLYRLADVVRKTASAYGIEARKVILDFTASVSSRSPDCKRLALEMCRQVFQKLNSNNDKSIVMLENEIIDFIRANFRRKSLSIQYITESFSIPALIISKIVKKKTGRKFNDYVNSLRIEHAKMLFATEDYKITAVCDESGYSDYGYFTKKFKEYTGVLPSEYKKKYR